MIAVGVHLQSVVCFEFLHVVLRCCTCVRVKPLYVMAVSDVFGHCWPQVKLASCYSNSLRTSASTVWDVTCTAVCRTVAVTIPGSVRGRTA